MIATGGGQEREGSCALTLIPTPLLKWGRVQRAHRLQFSLLRQDPFSPSGKLFSLNKLKHFRGGVEGVINRLKYIFCGFLAGAGGDSQSEPLLLLQMKPELLFPLVFVAGGGRKQERPSFRGWRARDPIGRLRDQSAISSSLHRVGHAHSLPGLLSRVLVAPGRTRSFFVFVFVFALGNAGLETGFPRDAAPSRLGEDLGEEWRPPQGIHGLLPFWVVALCPSLCFGVQSNAAHRAISVL